MRTAPDPMFLRAQIRWVMGRGVPSADAEDLVFDSWQLAASRHDPAVGPLEPLWQGIVRKQTARWWRDRQRDRGFAAELLRLQDGRDDASPRRAHQRQDALLGDLTDSERTVFDAWATQRHLGKGRVTSAELAASLGMVVTEYENAKRRLRTRLSRLLADRGWTPRALLHGDDDGP